MKPQVDAILLAAGESKRMGPANKLFLEVRDKPMIEHTIDALSQANIRALIIVTSPVNLQSFSPNVLQTHRVVLNPDYQKGMTTSIQKGVEAASPGAAGYMICMSDQPFMQAAEYDLLIQQFLKAFPQNPASIVVPFYQNRKGNPVIFSAQYRTAILEHQEMEGCKAIVQKNKPHLIRVDMPSDAIVRDIDTPEDYGKLA